MKNFIINILTLKVAKASDAMSELDRLTYSKNLKIKSE